MAEREWRYGPEHVRTESTSGMEERWIAMFEREIVWLQRFNRKAEALNRRQYLQEIRTKTGLRRISGGRGTGPTIEYEFPDEEHLFAFLFVLRQFDSPGDHISLQQIAEIHQRLSTSADLKRRALALADELKDHLAKPTNLLLNKWTPTRQEVFDILLYGGYAHSNDDKEPKFLEWSETEFVRVLTADKFGEIVLGYTRAIYNMRHINLEALAALETTPESHAG